MGGDREHTITVSQFGNLRVGGEVTEYRRVMQNDREAMAVYCPIDMSDDEARAVLTAPRSRPLPPGAPVDAVWKWGSDDLLLMRGCDVPEGWTWGHGDGRLFTDRTNLPSVALVEARPPQPPATERVRLDQIVGRVLAEQTEAVMAVRYHTVDVGWVWWGDTSTVRFIPMDADGMVEVIAP